jgi:succinoglycan biosynthesis transport protein ExoP
MDWCFALTAEVRNLLEGRLADLRARFETSEYDWANYAETTGIVTLSKSKSIDGRMEVDRTFVLSDLEALNSALVAATAKQT